MKCCLCGGVDFTSILDRVTDTMNWLPGEFEVRRCDQCGLKRTFPDLTQAELAIYYPAEYGPFVRPRFKTVRRVVRKFIPSSMDAALPIEANGGRALEIGCSTGGYLDKLVASGWKVDGIEFSPDAAKIARLRHPSVQVGAVEDASFDSGTFDLVLGWMVIEHLLDPVAGLRTMAEWTKPGGRLAFSVPNVDSRTFEKFGRHWYNLHVPNHRHHFDPATIERVLETAGWSLDRVHFQVAARTQIESVRLKVYPKRLPDWFSAIWETTILSLGFLLLPVAIRDARKGRADRMTVWATKK